MEKEYSKLEDVDKDIDEEFVNEFEDD